jgi:DNA-binding MarR family transcriptional regulator
MEAFLILMRKYISPSSSDLLEAKINLVETTFAIKDNEAMDPTKFFLVSKVFIEKGIPSMTELSEALSLSNSTTTRHVASWIKHELVEKIPDNKDGRFVRVKLTDKGQKAVADMRRFAIETIAETLDVLTESEQAIFLLLLQKLASK